MAVPLNRSDLEPLKLNGNFSGDNALHQKSITLPLVPKALSIWQ